MKLKHYVRQDNSRAKKQRNHFGFKNYCAQFVMHLVNNFFIVSNLLYDDMFRVYENQSLAIATIFRRILWRTKDVSHIRPSPDKYSLHPFKESGVRWFLKLFSITGNRSLDGFFLQKFFAREPFNRRQSIKNQ